MSSVRRYVKGRFRERKVVRGNWVKLALDGRAKVVKSGVNGANELIDEQLSIEHEAVLGGAEAWPERGDLSDRGADPGGLESVVELRGFLGARLGMERAADLSEAEIE